MGLINVQKFTFEKLPKNVEELKSLSEATLDTPHKSTALALVALLHYEENPQETIEMLNYLYGPQPVSEYAKQFIRDRLRGKQYKVNSFFEGSSVSNNYTPTKPYTIMVGENPYSYPDSTHAKMFVQSSGADSPRDVLLRQKPSTGQWFVTEIQCLADIRLPEAQDPWA